MQRGAKLGQVGVGGVADQDKQICPALLEKQGIPRKRGKRTPCAREKGRGAVGR